MLTSLDISNFKCFKQLKIEPLAKVNLFVGTSNSGKTSVLEAVSMLPATSPHPAGSVNWMLFRNGSATAQANSEYAKWQFHDASISDIVISAIQDNDTRAPIKTVLSAKGTAGGSVSSIVSSKPPINMSFLHGHDASRKIGVVTTAKLPAADLARSYDRWTLRAENDDRFVEFLQAVDPRLKSLRPMEHTGERMLYGDVRLPE
ncbi:MAG TPA: AAA family ATPase, partial [Prosthecobacter sp.]